MAIETTYYCENKEEAINAIKRVGKDKIGFLVVDTVNPEADSLVLSSTKEEIKVFANEKDEEMETKIKKSEDIIEILEFLGEIQNQTKKPEYIRELLEGEVWLYECGCQALI